VLRVIAARLSVEPADEGTDWRVDVAAGQWVMSDATRGETLLPRVQTLLFAVPQGVASCSAGPATSPSGVWQTLATSDGQRSVTATLDSGRYYILGPALAGKNGAILTVSHNIDTARVRLAAVDRSGREWRKLKASARVNDFQQLTAEFPLEPDAIKEYRLLIQPLVDTAVKGIALRPRALKSRSQYAVR
jgi:hypothetical protein